MFAEQDLNSQPLFFPNSEVYMEALLAKLQQSSLTDSSILEDWPSQRDESSLYDPDREDHQRAKEGIIRVATSLQQDYKLLRDLNSILPLGFKVSCYPDDPKSERQLSQHFALLSTAYDGQPWGEIYSTACDSDREDSLRPIFSLHDLRDVISRSAKHRELRFDVAKQKGWLSHVLDLLTWDIQSANMERVFTEKATQIQVEIIQSIGHLPFTVFYDGRLSLRSKVVLNGPAESCHKGKMGEEDVWAQPVPFAIRENGSKTFDEKSLHLVLSSQNLRHKSLFAWISVFSVVQWDGQGSQEPTEELILVTSRSHKKIVSLEAFYKDQWKDSHRFKLTTIGALAEATTFLKSLRCGRELDNTTIFINKRTTRCYLAHSRFWYPPKDENCSRDNDLEIAMDKYYRQACRKVVATFYPDPDPEIMGLGSFDESSLDLKSVMRMVRSFIKSEDIFRKVDNMHYEFEIVKQEIQNLPEIVVTNLGDSDISGDESDSTLIGNVSALSTPNTLSPATDDSDERSFLTKGKERWSLRSVFNKNKTSSSVNSASDTTSTVMGVPSEPKEKSKSSFKKLRVFGRTKS